MIKTKRVYVMYKISKKVLNKIIKQSFEDGEQWGITHAGWFIPEKKDNKNHLIKCKKSIYKNLLK